MNQLRNILSIKLFLLECFHKQNLKKLLPFDIYRYVGEFLLPNYQNIPIKGFNLSNNLNLSGKFPNSSPWKYYNRIQKKKEPHYFNEKYDISIGQVVVYPCNTKSVLGINFLKVRLNGNFLPIFSFQNNSLPLSLKVIEELAQIRNFNTFKKEIQTLSQSDKIIRIINNILKRRYLNLKMTIIQDISHKSTSDWIQQLINDIHHFLEIVHDSRYGFFKLKHIHYLLPKLIYSFKKFQNPNDITIKKDINIILFSSQNMLQDLP